MKIISCVFLTLCCLVSGPASAIRPIVHFHDLIAGEPDPGYRDGSFESAEFNSPQGLAFNEDGTRLFVADKNNNCIRVIFRDENNQVETLAGSIQTGYSNGSLKDARFNAPTALAYIAKDLLVVYDSGNNLFRLIDLKRGQVTDLAGNRKQGDIDGKALESSLGVIWNILYLPSDNCLYFSEPANNRLRKLDLTTGLISTVLLNDTKIPMPGPLCLYQNNLCVTDRASSNAFLPDFKNKTFQLIGNFDTADKNSLAVLATAASGEYLYGMRQGGETSWIRLPDNTSLKFVSVWGKPINLNRFPFFQNNESIGFIPDPREDRKFFLASSLMPYVMSLKDYNFQDQLPGDSSGNITDFAYPEKKPSETFRILVVGNSLSYSLTFQDQRNGNYLRSLSFPKQLELMLNTHAAMENVPLNYEVISVGRPELEESSYFWPHYVVPDIVKNYDIDLVLFIQAPMETNRYEYYFQAPLNQEGVPAKTYDTEYLLKPWDQKIPPGTPRDFYEKCLARKWVKPVSKSQLQFETTRVTLTDPNVREDVVELLSKPIKLLSDKLSIMKTSTNQPVKYQMVLIYRGDTEGSLDLYHDFWKRMAQKDGFPLLDLVGDFVAFNTTYQGMWSYEDFHYNADGMPLYAYIVGQELIDHHVIPFDKPVGKSDPTK